MTNRIIDIDFFDDAIDLFKFEYTWLAESNFKIDDLGRRVPIFTSQKIWCSLQPQQSTLHQTDKGNHQQLTYNWYCKAKYRVNIGDFLIDENGNYLHVDGVQQYDGWGVRQGTCTMINLSQYKNLQDYIKYLNGEKVL